VTDLAIPAISALRAYIQEHHDGSVSAFAREHKLDAADLGKILRQTGNRGHRVTVRYAERIEEATGGAVNIKMWIPVADKKE